jgi:TusA-related sulfurtransferase
MNIIAVNQAAKKLSEGETLTIEADDPDFAKEIQRWVEETGNELVELRLGPVHHAVIRRREKQAHPS